MKRKIAARLAALALAALMFCGCGQKPQRVQAGGSPASSAAAEPEAGPEDGEEAEEIEQPTAEEIAQAAVEAGRFSCNWFWDTAFVAANPWDEDIAEGDIIYATYVDKYGDSSDDWPFGRVNAPGINSLDDLRALTQQYYTAEVTDELLEEMCWIEQDGYLYVSLPDGIGGPSDDKIEVEVEKVSDEQYAVTIYDYFEGEPSAKELNYIYVDGYWVFDKALWYDWDLPATIRAAAEPEKDADKVQENSPASTAAAAAAIAQPTTEQIAQAAVDAGRFSCNWFWDSAFVAADPWDDDIAEGDIIYATYVDNRGSYTYDDWAFARVNAPGINNLNDLRALAQQYYTDAVIDELLKEKNWIEQNGSLYVSVPDGIGEMGDERIEVKAKKVNDEQYSVTIYEYYFDEDEPSVKEMNYSYINGYWVFDKELWFDWELPATVRT